MMAIKNQLKILRGLVEFYESSFSAGVAIDELLASRVESFLHIRKDKSNKSGLVSPYINQIDLRDLVSNSVWNYTLCCLETLVDLADVMKDEEDALLTKSGTSKNESEEPALLSVYHNQLLSKCFQFIICLGIYPRLERGVGIPLELRLTRAANFYCPDLSKSSSRDEDLLLIVKCFKKLFSNSELANILIKNYLSDLLAALLQISFSPNNHNSISPTNQGLDKSKQSSTRCISPIRRESRSILHDLMTSLPAPDIIKELLCLQGRNVSREKVAETSGKVVKIGPTPSWLRAGTGRLLTEQLLRSQGVLHLVSAFLNYTGSINAGVNGCKDMARIVTSVPRNMTPSDYWDKIAPQVRAVLSLSRNSVDSSYYVQFAVDCIHKLADSSIKLVRQHFFDHYLKDFDSILEPMPPDKKRKDGSVLLSSHDLDVCIQFLLHIMSTPDYSPKILSILQSYSIPLFVLYCELMEKPFKLKRDIYDIVFWIIKNSANTESVQIIKAMLNLGELDSSFRKFSQHAQIDSVAEGIQIVYIKESINPVAYCKMFDLVSLKVDVVITILTEIKESSLVGDLFVSILEEYTQLIYQHEEKTSFHDPSFLLKSRDFTAADSSADEKDKYIRGFCILNLLERMCDKVNEDCIQRSDQIITFAELTLSRCHSILKNTTEQETFNFESESLSLAMALLTHILTKKKILSKEKESMTRLMPLLHELSTLHPSSEIRDMANDLNICAVTRGAILGGYTFDSKSHDSAAFNKGKSKLIEELPSKDDSDEIASPLVHHPKGDSYTLSDALEDLCDPEVAVRGHGFIALANIVRRRDPSIVGKEDMLYQILKENIGHSDTYVYLAAIQGCSALALWNTDSVLPLLTNMFTTGRNQMRSNSDEATKQSTAEDSKPLLTNTEKIRVDEDVDYRLKIGEAIVQVSRDLGDMTPKYRDLLVSTFLKGAWSTDAYIRAASLSNLGEVCRHLKYSLGGCMHQIFSCCVALLQSDPEIPVRQGAALLITQTLTGCDSSSIEILGGSVLRDVYRGLKSRARVEKETSVLKQIDLALEELDRVMRDFIFPAMPELKKEIRVLHPFT